MNANAMTIPRSAAAVTLAVATLLASPGVAQAGRVRVVQPSPAAIAMTEGLLKVCAPVNPVTAADLRQKSVALAQGLSEDELAELRRSDEYQAAYVSLTDSLGAQDESALRQVCSNDPAAKP